MTETLNRLLDRASEHPGEGLRILDRRERSSWFPWPDIRSRALRVAGGLRTLGVARGDRVALIFPTCIEFFEVFFGILLAGAVPVPLYPPLRLGRLEEYLLRTAAMLRAVDARLLVADRRAHRLIGPAVESAQPPLGCLTAEALPQASPNPVEVDVEDLALVQFSSGTTVDPKPVALSHGAVVAQAMTLNGFWPDGNGQANSGASWLPLYHDMGLIGCVFPALERPASLTLIPPELFVARPSVWLRSISRYGATVSPAPNFAYGLCIDKIRDEEMDGVDLSTWRVALNGAEPVAPDVLRRFSRRFARWGFRSEALTPVYGLSEASLAVTFSDLDHPFVSHRFDREALAGRACAVEDPAGMEIVSVGHPLPGFEVRIVDRDWNDLPANRLGRVMVRGPSLMDGYLGKARATAQVLRDGWLDTGDLGFLAGGALYLTGRAKDVLILRGRNHSPVEVEHALDEVEGVRAGCAAAVSYLPEGAEGEVLVLLVEARKEIPEDRFSEVEAAAAKAVRVATGLQPDHAEVLLPGTLPRTSSGKIRRGEALRRWREAELEPLPSVGVAKITGAVIRSKLAMSRAARNNGRG